MQIQKVKAVRHFGNKLITVGAKLFIAFFLSATRTALLKTVQF